MSIWDFLLRVNDLFYIFNLNTLFNQTPTPILHPVVCRVCGKLFALRLCRQLYILLSADVLCLLSALLIISSGGDFTQSDKNIYYTITPSDLINGALTAALANTVILEIRGQTIELSSSQDVYL